MASKPHIAISREGERIPAFPRGVPTLPPLPSLLEPLYIIPDRSGEKLEPHARGAAPAAGIGITSSFALPLR